MSVETHVCVCSGVTEQEIVQAIRSGRSTLRDLQAELGICSSCGECRQDVDQLLSANGASIPSSAAAPANGIAAVDLSNGPGHRDLHPFVAPLDTREEARRAAETYCNDLHSAIDAIRMDDLATLIGAVCETVRAGGSIFLAGNGGSAATCSHMAADWTSAASTQDHEQPTIVALTDNVPLLTALANDFGYQETFSRLIERQAQEGDALLVVSVSGSSENLMEACKAARSAGMICLGLLGRAGPIAASLHHHVELGADYGLSEDLQSAFNHAVVRVLRRGVTRLLPAL